MKSDVEKRGGASKIRPRCKSHESAVKKQKQKGMLTAPLLKKCGTTPGKEFSQNQCITYRRYKIKIPTLLN